MRVAVGVERGDEAEEVVVWRGGVDPAVRTEPRGLFVKPGVIEGVTDDLRVEHSMLLPHSELFHKKARYTCTKFAAPWTIAPDFVTFVTILSIIIISNQASGVRQKVRNSNVSLPNAPPCMLAESTNGFSVIQRIMATVSNCLPVAWTFID